MAWTIVAYLVAVAVFELVLALQHSPSPDGEWVVRLGALIAMLVGAVLVYRSGGAAALIAPAAALFVTARFYTGDPYDEPGFQSYAEGSSPVWIFALLGLAFLAAATTLLWRRTAAVERVAVLLLLLFTAMFMGTH
jgi:uncharacterized membrane protein HdeD (DUF308 family)